MSVSVSEWDRYSAAALELAVGIMAADEPDRLWVENQLRAAPSAKTTRAAHALVAAEPDDMPQDLTEEEGAAALFAASFVVPQKLNAHGFEAEVVNRTMSDFGRHLRRHRRLRGAPGLLNWRWFRLHLTGRLIEVGRLQFELFRSHSNVSAVAGEWVVNLHIPADSGALSPRAVDESLARGAKVVRSAWPELHISHAICESWLLDPYLRERMPDSNIASFASRFDVWDAPVDEPTDPLYFLWGHRDLRRLPTGALSTLERVVVDRIAAGGTWGAALGVMKLAG